eukprot:6188337-Pleurochrysis_carterae.AAC.2
MITALIAERHTRNEKQKTKHNQKQRVKWICIACSLILVHLVLVVPQVRRSAISAVFISFVAPEPGATDESEASVKLRLLRVAARRLVYDRVL